jgi:tRNA threonylcarbamoyladenosine biosynthesis protein TsaB
MAAGLRCRSRRSAKAGAERFRGIVIVDAAPRRLILAIETSGLVGSVALLSVPNAGLPSTSDGLGPASAQPGVAPTPSANSTAPAVEVRLDGGTGRHAQSLALEVQRLLHDHGAKAQDVSLVGVSIGPGSFTGLRVGLTFAKTLAYAVGCPIVPVDSLKIFAWQAPSQIPRLWVVRDAQRGELFCSWFERNGDGEWLDSDPTIIVSTAEFWGARSPDEVVVGTVSPNTGRLASTITTWAQRPMDDWAVRPSAITVAQAAVQLADRGITADIWSIVPVYGRLSAAEEKRQLGEAP